MNKDKIIDLLKDHDRENVKKFAAYCVRLSLEKKKDGSLKNPWILRKKEEQLTDLFKRVDKEGLVLDGVHITLQSRGISYDYVAYKNKMLLAYPESKVDMSLVYSDEEFSFSKESGSVQYIHKVKDPFTQNVVVGGYCVIKNKRGEFITILNKADIEKHRKVAKTDYIWQQWFKEMALKTIIKKACKQHFEDVYREIELDDNENYNLDNPLDIELKYKQEIDAIDSVEELSAYYIKNKGKGAAFDKYVSIRKKALV